MATNSFMKKLDSGVAIACLIVASSLLHLVHIIGTRHKIINKKYNSKQMSSLTIYPLIFLFS